MFNNIIYIFQISQGGHIPGLVQQTLELILFVCLLLFIKSLLHSQHSPVTYGVGLWLLELFVHYWKLGIVEKLLVSINMIYTPIEVVWLLWQAQGEIQPKLSEHLSATTWIKLQIKWPYIAAKPEITNIAWVHALLGSKCWRTGGHTKPAK